MIYESMLKQVKIRFRINKILSKMLHGQNKQSDFVFKGHANLQSLVSVVVFFSNKPLKSNYCKEQLKSARPETEN